MIGLYCLEFGQVLGDWGIFGVFGDDAEGFEGVEGILDFAFAAASVIELLNDRLTHRIAQLTSQQCEQLAIDLGHLKTLKALDQWLEAKG